jgi:ParB family chromosome partitioning protein
MVKKKTGLGRGLDALLGEDRAVASVIAGRAEESVEPSAELPVEQLQAGRYQPRTRIDEGALNELAESIRAHGVMQPILVRPVAEGRYEIIAGERRYRAARLAGLTRVPVLVRQVSDESAAVMALIENMQREDLNPLEEAQGVQRLIDEFGMTHEQAAQAIGRSRPATSNLLRLLNLAKPVQTMLLANDLDMGHARCLLALDAAQQIQVANQVVARRLSVRETEKQVAALTAEFQLKTQRKVASRSRDVARLEEAMSDALGTSVSLRIGARDKGQIVIDFHGWEHLSGLLEKQGLGHLLRD